MFGPGLSQADLNCLNDATKLEWNRLADKQRISKVKGNQRKV